MHPIVDLGIPGYDQADEIGRGGFATVYRARRLRFGDWVAIKLIDSVPDERTLRRFERELEAMGKVAGHRNLVSVHDAGRRFDGRPYIVMELVPGGTLADRVRREGPLPWADTVQIGMVLGAVLQWAHDRGVIHRDVKPENVLVDDRFDETRDRIRLSDFGVAAIEGRTVTSEMWTVAHAAPEVILHGAAPSPKTDLYGLASTLYRLLDGEAPFVRADDQALGQVFARIQEGTIRDLRAKGVPDPVADVIEKGLEADPDDRPGSPDQLAAMLVEAAAQAGASAPRRHAHDPAPRPRVALARVAQRRSGPATETDPSGTSELTGTPGAGHQGLVAPLRRAWTRASRLSVEAVAMIVGAALALVVVVWNVKLLVDGRGHAEGSPRPTAVSSTAATIATVLGPTTTLGPGAVFSDNFAQDRGWRQVDQTSVRQALVDEQYQVMAKLPRTSFVIAAPQVTAATAGTRTRVEVDALVSPGAIGLVGVTCRQSGNSYYYGQVGPDGYWRIGRTGLTTLLRDARNLDDYVKGVEPGRPIRIALECSGGASGTTSVTLKLSVNGREVASATDGGGFAPGGVGLVLNPDVAGEWRFDNFDVNRF